jgi:hypothetical protein
MISALGDITLSPRRTLKARYALLQARANELSPREQLIGWFLTTDAYQIGESRETHRERYSLVIIFTGILEQTFGMSTILMPGYTYQEVRAISDRQNIRYQTVQEADELMPLGLSEFAEQIIHCLGNECSVRTGSVPQLISVSRRTPTSAIETLETMLAKIRAAQQGTAQQVVRQRATDQIIMQVLTGAIAFYKTADPRSDEEGELPGLHPLPGIRPVGSTIQAEFKKCFDDPESVVACWIQGKDAAVIPAEDQSTLFRILAGSPMFSEDADNLEYRRLIINQTLEQPIKPWIRVALAISVHSMGAAALRILTPQPAPPGHPQGMSVLVLTSPIICLDGQIILGPGNPDQIIRYCALHKRYQRARENLPLTLSS